MSLLALNGLRVSEATGADIEHLGQERGHRTLVVTRKDGKVVTIPLAPRTATCERRPRTPARAQRPGTVAGQASHRWSRGRLGQGARCEGRLRGS